MEQLVLFRVIGMAATIPVAVMNFLHTVADLYQKPRPLATVSWNG